MRRTQPIGNTLGLPAAAVIAWCLPLIPAGCQEPAAIGGPDALGQPPDSGLAPDAAVSPDAAPTPDAGACEPLDGRVIHGIAGSSGIYPGYEHRYEPLEGCEGQPWFFQDDRCFDWLLGQFRPDLVGQGQVDFSLETVVIVDIGPGTCLDLMFCALQRCGDEVQLSFLSCDCGSMEDGYIVHAIVIPKAEAADIVIECRPLGCTGPVIGDNQCPPGFNQCPD